MSRSWNPLQLDLKWLQNQDKVAMHAEEENINFLTFQWHLIISSVFFVRAPPAHCHPKDPPSSGESCKHCCCSPSSCLWAHLSWTIFPFCSRWTPREELVGYSCSAELDEEACDPWNTCSRSRWVACTQGDHIIMWSIRVWFTLPWLCVPSCSQIFGVCVSKGGICYTVVCLIMN